jgi:hypothetical protein
MAEGPFDDAEPGEAVVLGCVRACFDVPVPLTGIVAGTNRQGAADGSQTTEASDSAVAMSKINVGNEPFLVAESVSFIVPVRNDAVNLERCLEAIRANTYPKDRIEIIVADNGSHDRSREVAKRAGARTLELPGLTVGALRNAAVREAKGDILAFVDADHQIDANWLTHAVAALREPGTGAVGAPYAPPPQPTWVQEIYDGLRDHRCGRREVAWLGSGNLAVWRATFEASGGFDESLTTCEDVDLCARFRSRGYRILSDSRLRSVHYGDPASLGDVFRGELWRGRDNLRVTLRNFSVGRELPSVVMPLVYLGSIFLVMAGLTTAPFGTWSWAAAGVGGILLITSIRTARTVKSGRFFRPVALGRAFVVSAAYEAARALALVVHVGHRRAG